MATAPGPFSRFLADNISLVMAISDRGSIDEAELMAYCERHRGVAQATAEHLRRQLEELGILVRAAHPENAFELWAPVQDLLDALMRRQRLSSAAVLRAYFDELHAIERELSSALQANRVSQVMQVLPDAQRIIERIRALSAGNRDSIVTSAQELRSASEETSALVRVQTIRRLWERYVDPLRQLVNVDGELEGRLDGLQRSLQDAEQRYLAHQVVHAALGRTLPMLARMRRDVRADHQAAVQEIAPLYERLQRDSQWSRGASQALLMTRRGELEMLQLDVRLGLVGWRTRSVMSDDKLRARLVALTKYRPEGPVFLSAPPPPVELPLISRRALHQALAGAAPVDDALALVLSTWPEHPLRSQVAAFGQVATGSFGTVSVNKDARVRRYQTHGVVLVAMPVALQEVRA